MGGTGVAAHSGITSSTMGEGGGEGNDGRCGTGGKGDTGAICGSTGDKMGEGGAYFRTEGRGEDSEVGLASEISLTTSSSLNICTSSSRGNSSLNKAEAGGHSGITTSTAGGGGTAITASTAAAVVMATAAHLELKQDSAVVLSEHPNSMMDPKQSK